jgi:hypothetical protein
VAENSGLKDTVTAQHIKIDNLRHEIEAVIAENRQPSFDRILVTEQLDRKNYEHRIEVEKLLNCMRNASRFKQPKQCRSKE